MEKKPIISTPIEQFLKPMLDTWVRCGIKISFSRVENGVLYLNIDKRICSGCKGNTIRSRVERSVRRYYPNIISVQLLKVL